MWRRVTLSLRPLCCILNSPSRSPPWACLRPASGPTPAPNCRRAIGPTQSAPCCRETLSDAPARARWAWCASETRTMAETRVTDNLPWVCPSDGSNDAPRTRGQSKCRNPMLQARIWAGRSALMGGRSQVGEPLALQQTMPGDRLTRLCVHVQVCAHLGIHMPIQVQPSSGILPPAR